MLLFCGQAAVCGKVLEDTNQVGPTLGLGRRVVRGKTAGGTQHTLLNSGRRDSRSIVSVPFFRAKVADSWLKMPPHAGDTCAFGIEHLQGASYPQTPALPGFKASNGPGSGILANHSTTP